MSSTNFFFQIGKWILAISVTVSLSMARANETDEDESVAETLEQKFIRSNIEISEWFDSFAEGLDLFLAGKRLTKKRNETSVRVENTSSLAERAGTSNSTSINANLRLPNVEQYWQLKFATYDEQKEKRNVPVQYLRQSQRERNLGATLGLFQKLGNVRTTFEPRIELQDPLKVSHSLRFESVADLKKYAINPKLEFFANPSQGTGIFTALNFHFIFTPIYSLTLINQGEYQEKAHLFRVINGTSLEQVITEKSDLSYGLFFVSNNQPSYNLEAYSLSVSWSQILYKKILDYQLTPQLTFPRDQDFHATPGITLTLNLNF